MYDEWAVTIPELTGDEERRAYVYVPDMAVSDPSARFPVLYMFDGQNLFRDGDASYGKSWGILNYLVENNVPLIVAALECNHHDEADECGGRLSEYSPFDFYDRSYGRITGRGEITMEYLVNEFKPKIDRDFPTLPDRDHTFLSGSSMGGLMTLFGVTAYNGVFGRGAALSPSIGFSFNDVLTMIYECDISRTVLYMDNGSKEMRRARSRKNFAAVASALIEKGVMLDCRVVPWGDHSEASWQRQVPFFMETLFYSL